jgi:hypothetical protein
MSKRENLVETLRRLAPESVVDGSELCPACDGLSPALGYRFGASGEDEEYIINCSLCHSRHVVTVQEADRWRREIRAKSGVRDDD